MNKQQESVDVKEGNQYYIRMFARALYGSPHSWEALENGFSMTYPSFSIKFGKDLDGKCKTKIVFSNLINKNVKDELVILATTKEFKTSSEIEKVASKLNFARILKVDESIVERTIKNRSDTCYMINKIKLYNLGVK